MTELIIPENNLDRDEVISKSKEEDFSIEQDVLDVPPPYSQCSQWDELSIEQLLEKSREVLNLAKGDDKKEKDGEVLDKVNHPVRVRAKFYPCLWEQIF
jgi:hypothetical protein